MSANKEWSIFLKDEIKKPYYQKLTSFLKEQMKTKTIFPPQEKWFNALSTSPSHIKVIILGQDPYHGDNQAHGYSFSVQKGTPIPPSLINIYQEISREYNIDMAKKNGDLTPWVEQGVMLLNAILTVERGLASSHRGQGWEKFTDSIISTLSDNFENKVFLLWGAYAQSKRELIDEKKHLVLASAHPSPLARGKGFEGNNHFMLANEYLVAHNMTPIDWKISD